MRVAGSCRKVAHHPPVVYRFFDASLWVSLLRSVLAPPWSWSPHRSGRLRDSNMCSTVFSPFLPPSTRGPSTTQVPPLPTPRASSSRPRLLRRRHGRANPPNTSGRSKLTAGVGLAGRLTRPSVARSNSPWAVGVAWQCKAQQVRHTRLNRQRPPRLLTPSALSLSSPAAAAAGTGPGQAPPPPRRRRPRRP